MIQALKNNKNVKSGVFRIKRREKEKSCLKNHPKKEGIIYRFMELRNFQTGNASQGVLESSEH